MARGLDWGAERRVLRKFGIKHTNWPCIFLDQYRGTVLSCRYAIPGRQAVKIAVVDTVMRYPILQVGMTNVISKTPSWIQLQSLDLTQHIKWLYENFCAQLDDRFPDIGIEQPHWKITIFRQGSAPVMEVFHEDFLERLNVENGASNEQTGLNGDILKLPQAAPLLPDPNRKFKEHSSQSRAFFMDKSSLLAILGLCRQNKTTITALMNGLALISFSSHLDSKAAPAFQSSTIMDHRRNLPPAPPDAPWVRSDRIVANYVTQLPHRYDTELVARIRSKLPRVDVHRELWAEIVGKLQDGLRNDVVGLFKYVTDWQTTMKDMAKRTRQFSWIVTNVGMLDGSGNSTSEDDNNGQMWSISRAQFGVSAEIPAAAIEFSPVSVAGQGMCFCANWLDFAVDTTLGERIMADLERWLVQLANSRQS
ncbi:hypothetical protein B0H66DRAFT_575445 [Apodospora peruviana]|uniref:Alcohol acetyltransferase n=1 Tax=Apodospora peruviana TaxID=516989 RepID=A0AAE0I575_9PEZI|nr:hypothetical protein B0H66DRAFT_575445 [Apodospora peruviana]